MQSVSVDGVDVYSESHKFCALQILTFIKVGEFVRNVVLLSTALISGDVPFQFQLSYKLPQFYKFKKK